MTQSEFDSALIRILLTDTANLTDGEIKYALSKRELLNPAYVRELREAKAARLRLQRQKRRCVERQS